MRSLPDRPCHGETRQRAPVPVHVAVAVKDHVNVKAHVNVYEFSATQLPKSRLVPATRDLARFSRFNGSPPHARHAVRFRTQHAYG